MSYHARSFSLIRRVVIVAMMLVSSMLAQATPLYPLDPMDARFRNIRGLDFIMTIENPGPILGVPTPGINAPYSNLTYTDVASSAAMWMCYTGANVTTSVDKQLQRVYEAGFNTVRVWLSWQVYQFQPSTMVGRFQTFLQRCYHHGLYVIPVLWDNDFHEPSASSIKGADDSNYWHWIRSPGFDVIKTVQSGHLGTQHTQYVVDMVNAPLTISGWSHPEVVLMWDAMNEPLIDSENKQDLWISETLALIKTTNPNATTCVTPPFWDPANVTQWGVASLDTLDVMGFNFYGYGQRDIECLCDNVVQLCSAVGLPGTKPIVVMEAGRIGECMYYPEAINLLTGVPAEYTGNPTVDGVGFCLFSANVGQAWVRAYSGQGGSFSHVNFPFWDLGEGLLYSPNYDDPATQQKFVRDYYPTHPIGNPLRVLLPGALTAAAALALHSVPNPPGSPTPHFLPMPFSNANYIPQLEEYKFPDGTARLDVEGILSAGATLAPTCGLSRADWSQTYREISLAVWIYTWSFAPDWSRYHRVPKLVPPSSLGQMVLLWNKAIKTATANPTGWPHDPNFILAYQQLLTEVHTWWVAGGYDTWY